MPTNLRAFGAKTVGDLTMTRDPAEHATARPGRLIIEDVYVGGIVVAASAASRRRRAIAMCVFMLEDHQGAVEVVVFPEMFEQSSRT